MLKKPSKGTIIGVAFIATLMAALYLIPKYARQNKFSLNVGFSDREGALFPVDRQLTILEIGPNRVVTPKGKTSLAAIMKDNPGGVLVNFWASWCAPCIEELPSLEFLNRQLEQKKDKELPLIVAISVDDGVDEISTLFKSLDFAPTLRVLHDPSGDFSVGVGTTKFPETYLVRPDRKISQKWLGPQNWLSSEILSSLHTASR